MYGHHIGGDVPVCFAVKAECVKASDDLETNWYEKKLLCYHQ